MKLSVEQHFVNQENGKVACVGKNRADSVWGVK